MRTYMHRREAFAEFEAYYLIQGIMWFDLFPNHAVKSYSVTYIHRVHVHTVATTDSSYLDMLQWLLIMFTIYSAVLTKHSEWKTI